MTVRSLCFLPAHFTWQVNKLYEAIQSNLSEPSTSKHLLIQILKNQEELKATLKVHSSLLTNMLKNNDSSSEQSFTLPDDLSFPIKTIEKFEEMEIKLGDPSLKKNVVSLCYQIFCLFALHVKVPLRISKFLTEVAESNFEFWWLSKAKSLAQKLVPVVIFF